MLTSSEKKMLALTGFFLLTGFIAHQYSAFSVHTPSIEGGYIERAQVLTSEGNTNKESHTALQAGVPKHGGSEINLQKPLIVNLNSADLGQLVSLKGIGPKTAKKIVEYRNKHGLFSKVEDLIKIKGIGAGKLKTLKPFLVLDDNASSSSSSQ